MTVDLPTRRPGRVRRLLARAAVAVAVLVVGLLLTAEIVDDRRGCGSVDPTDPANYSAVSILNDTAAPVRLDDCEGTYCSADLPADLAPGRRLADHAACGASGSDMTSWRVSTPDGRLLGYLAVDSPRKRDGLVIPVSHAGPDRRTPTPPA